MAGPEPLAAVAVHYFMHVPNVGDRVSPLIVAGLSGRPAIHTADLGGRPHIMAVGSIASRCTASTVLWGTGVMAPEIGIGTPVSRNVAALRGKRSHEAFRAAGLALGDIPLGDPAILAARLLGVRPHASASHPIGVVAHYAERRLPLIGRLLREDGIVDLDVHDDPRAFLGRMAGCRAILSTSLHGLIFAESMGLPNLWIKASDLLGGGPFKFEDWFSTTRRPQREPHLLAAGDTAHRLAQRAELHELAVDEEALVMAFPRDREDLLRPQPLGLLPIEACRRRPMPVFLVSRNRGPALRDAIAALRRQTMPVDIVVHDNGSTDPGTQGVLTALERAGTVVIRRPESDGSALLTDVDATIRGHFAAWAEPRSFAVGRDAVDLSRLHPRALELYAELINRFPIHCAGPMVGVGGESGDEVPLTGFGTVRLTAAAGDLSFAVYRAGDRLQGDKAGMRTGPPYDAAGG